MTRRALTHCGMLVLLGAACASTHPASGPPSVAASIPGASLPLLESRMPARVGAFALNAHERIAGTSSDAIYRYRDSVSTNLSVILYSTSYAGSDATGSPRNRVDHEGSLFAMTLPIQQNRRAIESWRLLSQRSDSMLVAGTWIPGHVTVASTTRMGRASYELQFLHIVQGNYVKVRISVPEQGWPRNDLAAFDSALVTSLASR